MRYPVSDPQDFDNEYPYKLHEDPHTCLPRRRGQSSEQLYQRILSGWTGYTAKEAALAILCKSPTEIVQLLMALKPQPEKMDTTI